MSYSPLSIAMVSEHASPLAALGGVDSGGQNVHVASLSAALARRGHRVIVYTRRDDPGPAPRVELRDGVVIEHVNAGPAEVIPKDKLLPHMDAFAEHLRRAWRASRPDVVHAHFWMSGRAAVAAARSFAIPVAQTFHALGVVKRRHQGDKDTSPPSRIDEECSIIQRCQQILATCSDELFELVRLGADPTRISIVPCGVELDLFKPEGDALPRRDGLRRVVIVSRLVERKGIGNAISALKWLPKTELVIAGGPVRDRLDDDQEVKRYRIHAARCGVSSRVEFLGSIERAEVPRLLRSADVVACVPWYEPFGMVALEAMACGVPVVASAVGGQVDTVVDGVTGLHVPPRQPRAIAKAIRTLLADPETRARMGAAGVERARARYGWDELAATTEDCYRAMTRIRVAAERAR